MALGAIAQLEEHLLCKQGVTSSSLVSSTPTSPQVKRHPLAATPSTHCSVVVRRARCVPVGRAAGPVGLAVRPACTSRSRLAAISSWRSSDECRYTSASRVLAWPMRAISSRRLAPALAVSAFPVCRRSWKWIAGKPAAWSAGSQVRCRKLVRRRGALVGPTNTRPSGSSARRYPDEHAARAQAARESQQFDAQRPTSAGRMRAVRSVVRSASARYEDCQGGALRAPRADASARPLPWKARPARRPHRGDAVKHVAHPVLPGLESSSSPHYCPAPVRRV